MELFKMLDMFPCTVEVDLFPCTVDIHGIASTHVETVVQLLILRSFDEKN